MKIVSRVRGQGPVLILIHGYAGSVLHWENMVASLESHFTCVILNYSQFYLGREAMPFSQQVDELSFWIEKNYPRQKVSVAGMSFGGALAWALSSKYSQLIDRCVFINPMPADPARSFAMKGMRIFFALPLYRKTVFIFLSTNMGQKFLQKCAQIFRLRSEKEASRLNALQGRKRMLLGHLFNNFAWILKQEKWDFWKQKLQAWNHPSLLIYDDQDPLFAPQTYLKMDQVLRCDETLVLSGAGHIATGAHSEMIAKEIRIFLEKNIIRRKAG